MKVSNITLRVIVHDVHTVHNVHSAARKPRLHPPLPEDLAEFLRQGANLIGFLNETRQAGGAFAA